MPKPSPPPLKVFYAYARVDAQFRTELDKHLVDLRNRKLIEDFFDGDIESGEDWDRRIRKELEDADLILLLISTDFLTSAYGAGVELARALQRHEERTACVVPIHIRPVYLKDQILSALQALPRNGAAVSIWPDRDSAYVSIAADLEHVVEELRRIKPQVEYQRQNSIPRLNPRIPREPVVPFVSRRDQSGNDLVPWISALLAGSNLPVLALWGSGGVGKTTLAAQVARELQSRFPGRIAWVSADGRDSYSLEALVDDAGAQLGCPAIVMERQAGARSRQVAALIGNLPALIVFDNMETIGDEQAARCVDWLTNELRSPVLITTRDHVRKVRNIPLQPMSPVEVQQFLDGLLEQSQYPDAVRRYTDSIIRISEANPLILQWIVSQVDLAQDPVDVFHELQHGEGDAARRVFDRSFNLSQTTDDGRSVLLALALFPDSASRPALAFVAGFDHDVKRANDAIARLAGLRLVGFGEKLDRIRIEGLTRELAAAKLAQNDRPSFASRFVEFFSQFAQHLYDTEPVDTDALTVELSNVKIAVDLAYEMHLDEAFFSLASSMAAPVTGLLVTRGQWQDAVHMNQLALEIANATNDDKAVQFFGHNLGAILVARGRALSAEAPLHESLHAAERNEDQYHAVLTRVELATVAFMKGDTDKARSQYEESLKLASVNSNLPAMAASLHQLGLLAQEAGDLDEARSMFVESLRIKQSQPESVSLARTLMQLGALAEIQGKAAEASGAYNFALQVLKRLRSPIAAEAQELFDRTTRRTPPAES